jgi:DNA-binding transcriptional ArsR family regulator
MSGSEQDSKWRAFLSASVAGGKIRGKIMSKPNDNDSDAMDPVLIAVLTQLWRAANTTPDTPWSLAKLSKQAGLQMSTLRRQLTPLTDAQLVTLVAREDGSGTAALTPAGVSLCAELFGMGAAPPAA